MLVRIAAPEPERQQVMLSQRNHQRPTAFQASEDWGAGGFFEIAQHPTLNELEIRGGFGTAADCILTLPTMIQSDPIARAAFRPDNVDKAGHALAMSQLIGDIDEVYQFVGEKVNKPMNQVTQGDIDNYEDDFLKEKIDPIVQAYSDFNIELQTRFQDSPGALTALKELTATAMITAAGNTNVKIFVADAIQRDGIELAKDRIHQQLKNLAIAYYRLSKKYDDPTTFHTQKILGVALSDSPEAVGAIFQIGDLRKVKSGAFPYNR